MSCQRNRFAISLVLLGAVILNGCAAMQDPYTQSGLVGGLIGSGIGAGVGALYGSKLTGGDIAKSATVGAAGGLAMGVLAGVAYRSYKEESVLRANRGRIRQNYEYIMARRRLSDEMREELSEETFAVIPDRSLRADIYTGPTIGNFGHR